MMISSWRSWGATLLALLALPIVTAVPSANPRSPRDARHSALAASHARRGVSLGWNYGQEKIRGVNLGGWLLLEPWITPSLFDATGNNDIVDEYTFCQFQDRKTAQKALKRHWDTFVTENDFAQIAAAGLNHVRIPIGFWAYDVSGGEPYIQGQAEYLDRAIGWARNHGLKVMLDLHGAPGSQNGFDNSGRRGNAEWANNYQNVYRAKKVVELMSKKYSDPSYYQVVTALCLLNEPAGYQSSHILETTRQYWYDAYGAARYPWAPKSGAKSGLLLVISDAFQPLSTWSGFMPEPSHESVAIDTHYYQVFSDAEVSWDQPVHLSEACNRGSAYSAATLWTFVGEWSLASTDCAKYLNGRGLGSRYDGSYPGSRHVGSCQGKTGSVSSFSSEYKQFLRNFWDAQTQTFEKSTQGWIFWCWKNEDAPEWSYSAGLQNGWIPHNPTEHQYQC